MAHDFNNLLSVILGYGEYVLERHPEPDEARDNVVQIIAAADRAAALTRQLLAFSRQRPIEPVVIDLNAVILDTERMLHRLIGAEVVIQTDLQPDLASIRADPTQLEQILLNLVVNARDAMPGGGSILISTRLSSKDAPERSAGPNPAALVELCVADTGSGMDDDTKQHLFEPFFTTKPVGKGTGLGLATVYGIIQQSGARIRVESDIGVGTRFRMWFPTAGEETRSSPPRPEHKGRPRGAGTVLLVEDEDAVRRVAARTLREQGYTVLEAQGVAEARQLCEQHRATIDLLLTNVVMPELSGPKLAEELTVILPGLRVLFMSGYSGNAFQHSVMPAASSFVEKPFTPAVLARKVAELLDS